MKQRITILCITLLLIIFSASSTALADCYYIITGNNVNLRSEPTISDSNIIDKMNYGDLVTITEFLDNWCFVYTNNQSGYVSADYIGVFCVGNAAYTTARVNFRAGPSTTYKSYGVLPTDTIVKVIDSSSKWYMVEYNNITGYICSDYLTFVNFDNELLQGIYSTNFSTGSSQSGRVKNIQKGATLINEYVVVPNQTFSLLEAIGPITKDNGYYEAPEYKKTSEGTETVSGYGGGVCQIATTLYQSVRSAKFSGSNLEIIEHHHHSKSVSYIDDGQDATISWNAKRDFKFKNNNSHSIKIRTYVHDGTITCMIYVIN